MDGYSDYRQAWPPHLLQPTPFPTPPASEHGAYPQYYPQDAARSPLSLNIASLTVASPTNLSPINPPGSAAQAALSPVTPISPSTNPFQQHQQHHAATAAHHQQQHIFAFDQSPSSRHYDEHGMLGQPPQPPPTSYEIKRTPAPSRSSSGNASSTSQLPRKRSFTAHPSSPSISGQSAAGGGGVPPSSSSSSGLNGNSTPATSGGGGARGGLRVNVNVSSTLVEEMYDDEARDEAMALASAAEYDDLEVRTAYGGAPGSAGAGSPVDGSGSTSGPEDSYGMISMGSGGMGGSMGVIGKPVATNNFVTKLYQMISDPKSAQFIAWTELGTSFVVSNVGEFSRSILGSHFKHNNFSSFVRQLNMYGFHKINRTPRAQRTSTDAQTWEFSHHKFLRGRPDLLDEIKRKALEPDPGIKHRIELPGEVANQLNVMKEEIRRWSSELAVEKRKTERLTSALGQLWDVVGKAFPGSVPPFSLDLLESSESPNIYVTSPTTTTASRFPPPLSMNQHAMHGLSSPTSSPTAADFPAHSMSHRHSSGGLNSHPLSRQHSFHQHMARGESSSSTPLPSSPGSISMDLFDDGTCDPPPPSGRALSAKRQRLDEGGHGSSVGNGNGNGGPTGGGGGGGGLSMSMSAAGSETNLSLMSSVSSPGGTGPAGQGQGQGGLAGLTVPKKSVRARSDSAPLGYVGNVAGSTMTSWGAAGGGGGGGQGMGGVGMGGGGGGMNGIVGRPRSGSGMMPRIANMARNGGGAGGPPLLSITTHETGLNSR